MSGTIYIVYDGECPFCSAYVRMMRLKAVATTVLLVNARDGGPIVDELEGKGLNLDDGMAVKVGDAVFFGDEAVHRLALMSSPSNLMNRLYFWIFKSPARSKMIYPYLRAGRNLLLRILGKKQIN